MARPKKEEAAKTDILERVPTDKAIWWYGMLPAEGPVEMELSTNEEDPETGRFVKRVEMDPLRLWHGTRSGPLKEGEIFIPKLRAKNAVGAGGIAFNSYSAHVMQTAAQANYQWFPGGCQAMTDAEAKRAIEGIRAHFVRFSLGIESRNAINCGAEVWDTRLGKKPPHYSPRQWEEEQRLASPPQCPDFDKYTDIWLDEFVYLVKLDVDWRKWPSDDFLRDPHAYYKQVTPSMEEFFQHPPESVADMHPREA